MKFYKVSIRHLTFSDYKSLGEYMYYGVLRNENLSGRHDVIVSVNDNEGKKTAKRIAESVCTCRECTSSAGCALCVFKADEARRHRLPPYLVFRYTVPAR